MDYEVARSSLKYRNYTPEEYIVKLVYSIDEYDEIIDIRESIMSYVEKSTIEFITGAKSIDDYWEEYVSSINAMGLEHYMNITQSVYDRMKN